MSWRDEKPRDLFVLITKINSENSDKSGFFLS